MFHISNQPQIFSSREESSRRILIEFDRSEHFNSLIKETWCPLHIRLDVAREKACKKQIIILCETETEALKTAEYHFYSTGSNFIIKDNLPNA